MRASAISGVDVVEEAARLVKQIRFSANRPAYSEGEHVAVSVDPRWSDDNERINVSITCFALGHQQVDWEGLRINIERRQDDRSITWLSFLDARGQAVRNELPVGGEYSLSLPYRVKSHMAERVLYIPKSQIRSRGGIQLAYDPENTKHGGTDQEATSDPLVREGQSREGSILWTVRETGKGLVEVSFEINEELSGHQIAFSLVESTTGRVQHSGMVALVPAKRAGRWEGRALIDSFELTRPCDLVFEPLPPADRESP